MSEARARYDAFYRSSLDDPETFWLEEAQRLDWTRPPDRAFEQPRAADLPLVPRRADEPDRQRARSPRRGRPRRHHGADRARRAGWSPRAHVRRAPRRGRAGRRRPARPRHRQGRPPHDLHADLAEAIIAMLATVRIGAIHCVVFAGFGAGALGDRIRASGSRLVLTTRHHLPQGQGRRPPRDRRRRARRRPERRRARRGPAHGRRVPAATRRRAGVGRPPRRGRGPVGRRRGHPRRGPGVHPRDLGHDRQAEARRPHPRRLCRPRRLDGRLGVRPSGRARRGGRRPTSAGSSATATSSTRR